MTGGWPGKLRKLDDFRWEIPKDYKPGMRVPGLVFADEAMMQSIAEDQALEQVANVACLPGIVDHALAMPDIHWGYGFPVGGVAATRLTDGVVSPGGIGYDINCLPGESRILLAEGAWVALADVVASEARAPLAVTDLASGESSVGRVTHAITRVQPADPVRIRTAAGDELLATSDHPLWTPAGMTEASELRSGDLVAVHPFTGQPYERPEHRLLVSEDDVRRVAGGVGPGAPSAEIDELRSRGLLPLYLDDFRMAALLRLIGFVTGDGHIGSGRQRASAFYGRATDLEALRSDVGLLGFTSSRVYSRRQHRVAGRHGDSQISTVESSVRVPARSFGLLLRALGAPAGNKTTQIYRTPDWILSAPRWQKRLYLAGYFGAEMSAPRLVSRYDLQSPGVGVNKASVFSANAAEFLGDIQRLLGDLDVESSIVGPSAEDPPADGSGRVRWRLLVSSKPVNLIRLYTTVGFAFQTEKQHLGVAFAQHLKRKLAMIDVRERAAEHAVVERVSGEGVFVISANTGDSANRRLVERLPYGGTRTRPSTGPEEFAGYARWATAGLGSGETLWEEVASVEEAEHPGPFFDISVDHPDHNFVADGFVVSNCGVRLLNTTLTETDVRPRVTEVANQLFRDVPSGMGQEGRLPISAGELDNVLERGAQWMVAQGYGRAEDPDHIEERGRIPGADAERVSQRAKSRGSDQLGTLGSGNHFLEVQVVDRIFEPVAATRFGLGEVGRVAVFIHTGSRGLGHQVCEDYLRVAEANLRRYSITLPDRQLACMPLGSPEARQYLAAMAAAANFAFANRQLITHWVREAFARVMKRPAEELGLNVVYDVAHNIAKNEEHAVGGGRQVVCVHRKGATRAFPAGHPSLPMEYRDIGQPVLIPGDMGRYSFVAVGTERAMRESFGSVCHGAGRLQSRGAMRRTMHNVDLVHDLAAQGITVKVHSRGGLVEEASAAYKDVADVIRVVAGAGLATPVVRLRPLAVIKG